MGILLGLSAALSWGLADFLARFLTRRVGTLRTFLYMQVAGLFMLSLALPALGGWGHLADGSGWRPWAWGALAGSINAGATLALYRSFEIGKFAIVAPISSSFPALTVLLSMAAGEKFAAGRGAGIVLTLIGVILAAAAREPAGTAPQAGAETVAGSGQDGHVGAGAEAAVDAKNAGVLWALVAAEGFGVLFWLLGFRVAPRVGAAAGVWIIRLTSMTIAFLAVLIARQPVRLRPVRLGWMVLGTGLFDTGAYVCNNLGVVLEQVSVVSVLASLYGVVTVALAAILLREKLAVRQWIGVLLIFVGIVLISK